jgi:DNA-binding response OmpR family regulator
VTAPPAAFLRFADLELELTTNVLRRGDQAERLSGSFFFLMRALMTAHGRPVSADHLLGLLWNHRADGPQPKIINTCMCRLRALLRRLGSVVTIPLNQRGRGVHNAGYRLFAPAEPSVLVTVSMPRADFELLLAAEPVMRETGGARLAADVIGRMR